MLKVILGSLNGEGSIQGCQWGFIEATILCALKSNQQVNYKVAQSRKNNRHLTECDRCGDTTRITRIGGKLNTLRVKAKVIFKF